jgi:dihydrofolate synthase/folylpolyglutamate synthase
LTYTKLVNEIFAKTKNSTYDLKTSRKLDEALGFPSKQFPSVHVAGTNGKGSVVYKISQALTLSGMRVGRFISPHILNYRERFQIDGKHISEELLLCYLTRIKEAAEQAQVNLSFFEHSVLTAFLYFAEEKVDCAVIEVGLGGRLDATNILFPELSVITSIGLDHCDVLGHDLQTITREKAGIIKPKVPVVIGPTVPLSPIKEIAEAKESPVIQLEGSYTSTEEENTAIAKKCLEILQGNWALNNNDIQKGLNSIPLCRYELVQSKPIVILDVAHNPPAFKHLFKRIEKDYPEYRIHLLLGMCSEKNLKDCFAFLPDTIDTIYPLESDNPRRASKAQIAETLKTFKLVHTSSTDDAVENAVNAAKKPKDLILATGSIMIMKDVRKALGIEEDSDPIDLNER